MSLCLPFEQQQTLAFTVEFWYALVAVVSDLVVVTITLNIWN